MIRLTSARNNPSREGATGDRDRPNAFDPKSMPFDIKRMDYGGFKIIVDA